jgi:hypothetical protein
MIKKGVAVAAAALLGAGVIGIPSAGAAMTPGARPWTVASGLDNPRGLAFGPHGELFVAEAGRGGRGPCRTGAEGDRVCFGPSGAISEIVRGEHHRIVKGLPSLAAAGGAQAIGP